MPRKTIYVSEEDNAVFKEYADKVGDDGGLGKVLADALRERLQQRHELETLAFRLCLLIQGPETTKLVADLAQYRFDDLPEDIKTEAMAKTLRVMAEDPSFFELRVGEERKSFFEALILDDNEWFEEAEKLAAVNLEKYKLKASQHVRVLNRRLAKLKQRRRESSGESAAPDDILSVLVDISEDELPDEEPLEASDIWSALLKDDEDEPPKK